MALVIILLASFLIALLGTGITRRWLLARAVLDLPNARSNHAVPTPRGGGIAVTAAILLPLGLAFLWHSPDQLWLLLITLALAVLSFLDDTRGLPILPRFGAQILAVAFGLARLPHPLLFDWLPPWLDGIAAALLWLWCINAVNFMDGIDGITAVETLGIAAGTALALFLALPTLLAFPHQMHGIASVLMLLACALGGAMLGFLRWNWHKAKIFLGDVGSVPLGYLLGFLLLGLAATGHGAIALILPAYYAVDATFTLLARIARGHKPWEAHSQHAYQTAVRAGASHAKVSMCIATLNFGLVILAAAVATHTMPEMLGIAIAYFAAIALAYFFRR